MKAHAQLMLKQQQQARQQYLYRHRESLQSGPISAYFRGSTFVLSWLMARKTQMSFQTMVLY